MTEPTATPSEAVQYWYDAATERREERDRLRAVVARIAQMADAWEQRLPETIRTPAVVSAIRAALEPAAAAVPVAAPPTTEQAEARCAVCRRPGDDSHPAVCLPPAPADRAAIRAAAFDEAAEKLAGLDPVKAALAGQHAWSDAAGVVRHMAVKERRMATGEQQPAAEPESGCAHCGSSGHVWDDCEAYTALVAADDVQQAGGPSREATEPQPDAQADEEPITCTQQCGHDDYHDPHQWADRPKVWCPGWSFADDAPAVSSRPGTEQEANAEATPPHCTHHPNHCWGCPGGCTSCQCHAADRVAEDEAETL